MQGTAGGQKKLETLTCNAKFPIRKNRTRPPHLSLSGDSRCWDVAVKILQPYFAFAECSGQKLVHPGVLGLLSYPFCLVPEEDPGRILEGIRH